MKPDRISPKKLKLPLILILVFIIAGLGAVYYIERITSGREIIKNISLDSKAVLSLSSMHQTSTRNGIKEWTLDASSAQLLKDEKIAVMKDVNVVFFLENSKTIQLTSKNGALDTESHNMKFSGNVVVVYTGRILETDELHYEKKRHIIYSTTHSRITGNESIIEADSFETDINKKITVLKGNVKGRLSEKFDFFYDLGSNSF